MKSIQTDGGGQFKTLAPYLAYHGIAHPIICPYTSEQNGIAERKHRHIVGIWLTLMHQASCLCSTGMTPFIQLFS